MEVVYKFYGSGVEMKLIIDERIRENYPDLRVGVVIASNVENMRYSNELKAFTKQTFLDFTSKYNIVKNVEFHPNIAAWRDIYRSFGVNPKKKKPTAEALLVRVIKNNFIPYINSAVDSYLCAQVEHLLPIGGYNIEKIKGNITLRYSVGGESFLGVGAKEKELTIKNEVVYSDDNSILTRCWNYRDCDYCKIDTITKTLVLFVEAPLISINDNNIIETTQKIADNLNRFCGANCTLKFLSAECNELDLV